MSLHRFCEITGLSKVSAWRYEKRGWLRTHLIANRRYILAVDVAEFNRRLASDEFAGSVSNLSVAPRSNQRKKRKESCGKVRAFLAAASDVSLLFGTWRGLGFAAAAHAWVFLRS